MLNLWSVAPVVLLLNLPFGFWRAGVRKFSLAWFLAIHVPIPAVVALRFWAGLGFHWTTYPPIVGAYFAGQFLGARAGRWWGRNPIQGPGV
jgi:hypothetical protein